MDGGGLYPRSEDAQLWKKDYGVNASDGFKTIDIETLRQSG